MEINEFYKIESDRFNVTLYKRRKKGDGYTKWREYAYFCNPQNALEFFMEREIMGAGLADLKMVVRKIRELHRLVGTLQGLPELRKSRLRR